VSRLGGSTDMRADMRAVLTVDMGGETFKDAPITELRKVLKCAYIQANYFKDRPGLEPLSVYDSKSNRVGDLRIEDTDASTEAINPERELAVRWQERAQELEAINAEMLAALRSAADALNEGVASDCEHCGGEGSYDDDDTDRMTPVVHTSDCALILVRPAIARAEWRK
jgi:hypothetical protein